MGFDNEQDLTNVDVFNDVMNAVNAEMVRFANFELTANIDKSEGTLVLKFSKECQCEKWRIPSEIVDSVRSVVSKYTGEPVVLHKMHIPTLVPIASKPWK